MGEQLRLRSERDGVLESVRELLSHVYHGDQEAVDEFLNRRHPLLEGETPFDMAHSSLAGAKRVLDLIQRAEAGVAL